MYRLLKQKDISTVAVENADTKANVIISKLNQNILDILTEAGVDIPKDYCKAWDFPISKELATKLVQLAMPMKKPIRDQSKKAKDLFRKPNKEIDAMDVLLGLASYN